MSGFMHVGDLMTSRWTGDIDVRIASKRAFASYLRQNQTPAERMMARVLFHLGIDAAPQVPILGWIVDFYDDTTRTVIEVDGGSHTGREEADAFRDGRMRECGFRVIRVTNAEVYHFLANLAESR